MNNDTGFHVSSCISILVETSENIPLDIGAQRSLKSTCVSAHPDQRLHCVHEDMLPHWLSKMYPVKFLVRPRECVYWSESELCTNIQRYVYWIILLVPLQVKPFDRQSQTKIFECKIELDKAALSEPSCYALHSLSIYLSAPLYKMRAPTVQVIQVKVFDVYWRI